MADIALFDFISHETMHHAFNEGYLRMVRAAFPSDRIVFHARAGHLANLAPRLADLPGLEIRPCPAFSPPFGLSRHNPLAGAWAAAQCRRVMVRAIAGGDLRFAALLGVDASLFGMARRWPAVSPRPLHLILHGQLGETMLWRSRNPLLRMADFVARLRRPLPGNVRLVTLELGVADAIAEIAPQQRATLATLEHPVLVSEWAERPARAADHKLRLGFLGHARRAKGYEVFTALARDSNRPDLEFHAVGQASADTAGADASALARLPSPTPLPRTDYLEGIAGLDLVCLPLHSRAYDFTASGTVSDAIAGLRPLLALRSRTLTALAAKYGEIGYLADSQEALFALVRSLDIEECRRNLPAWRRNLEAIREARRPERLAAGYRALLPVG